MFHTLMIAGTVLFPAWGIAQNNDKPVKEEHQVKIIIEGEKGNKKHDQQIVKVVVMRDSIVTINFEGPEKNMKTMDIDVRNSDEKMDILIREDGKEPKKISLDLKKMEKELEELSRTHVGEVTEEEINRILEKYIPQLENLEDFGVILDKEMEMLEIEMENLEEKMSEIDKLENLDDIIINIEGDMDTLVNEVTISDDGKWIKKVLIVRSSVNVTDLTDDEWKDIRKREGEKKTNTMKVDKLEFYPNPSDGKFNVNFISPERGDLFITVMDMNGKFVYEETVPNFQGTYSKAYDLSAVGKGMYILRMNIGKESYYKKLIVE